METGDRGDGRSSTEDMMIRRDIQDERLGYLKKSST